VGAATGLRWLLQDYLGTGVAFITYYPALALVAMFAGGGPGLLATVLSAVVAVLWFPFLGTPSTGGTVVGLGSFFSSGLIISTMAEMLQRARQREKVGLKAQVAERTADLEQANAKLRKEIEARQRVEGTLRESEERFRKVFENALVGIAISDRQGQFQQCNPAYSALLGYSEEEFRRINFASLVHPEDREANLIEIRRLQAGEVSSFEIENRYVHKNGQPVWVHKSVSVLPDETGEPAHLVALVLDVTQRRRIEEQREQFVSLAKNSHEFIGMCDMHFQPFFANEAAMRMVGLDDLEQTLRTSVREFFFPEDQPFMMEKFFPQVLRDGHGEVEIRFRHFKTGEPLWMIYSVFSLRDPSGQPSGFATVSRNITERRQAEQQLTRDLDGMTHLQKLGGLFVQGSNLEPVLTEVVDAAIAITDADFGNVQLIDPVSGDLRIAAHRGFSPSWIEFWNAVAKGRGVCGTALERGERVIVEDIEQSPIFVGTPALDIQRKAGVRAVQSTPLVSRSGKTVGMFSTHYRTSRRPDERSLRLLDLLARQAADIIEHSQAAELLRESEQRLQLMADALPALIAYVDADGCYQFNNAGYERWFRLPRVSCKGRHMREVLGEAAYDGLKEHVGAALAGQPRTFEAHVPYQTGGERDVLINYVPHRNSEDRVLGFFALILDLTERKQAERALRASEELKRAVLASLLAHCRARQARADRDGQSSMGRVCTSEWRRSCAVWTWGGLLGGLPGPCLSGRRAGPPSGKGSTECAGWHDRNVLSRIPVPVRNYPALVLPPGDPTPDL
jgi:PAS domain S-box-containing protein